MTENERHKLVHEIELHRIELEMQNSELRTARDELEKLNAELVFANNGLEAFNYAVAHDLRTPLTVINGYCQLLQELCGTRFNDECRGYLRDIYEATLKMKKMTTSLLDFSKLTSVKLCRETVDLTSMAKDVAAGLPHTVHQDRQISFRIAEGVTCYGDAGLLHVLLDNLIGNAWKHSCDRVETVIEFGITEVGGKPAYFISDNGPGFDMAEAEKLFIPFQRLSGTTVEGHGIGLAMVDRIVRLHGGKVWAESEPGKGAIFYFSL